jgi:hypothetical protein
MIPVKLFQRLTDYEEEYLHNPTPENSKRVNAFQDEIHWPFNASQEQLDYWNNINHIPDIIKCPKCGNATTKDHNSVRCDQCQRLWPLSYLQIG